MAKDPAVLFYTSDFLCGTMLFNYEDRGKYITLLCIQHQLGSIPEEHMINICKTYDNQVMKKFIKDEDGNYYNKRMRIEIEKRSEYCLSRRNNRNLSNKKVEENGTCVKHTSDICGTYVERMENENENENENINRDSFLTHPQTHPKHNHKFKLPNIEDIKKYCDERRNNVDPQKWYDFYSAKGWMIGKNKMKDWKAAVRTWETNKNKEQDDVSKHYNKLN